MNLPAQTGFLGHPQGLRTLFFAEFWERFSYYGMRALLILFMTAPVATGGLGWDTAKAGPIYGMYTAMVYLMALPGGWLADRILGQRRAVFAGGVVIMCGHIALAVPSLAAFYTGLILVVIGTGLLKPNISTIVGQLYGPADQRRDAGFTIFYMGINLGAMLAPLATGWLAQSDQFKNMLTGWGMDPATSWHWGFGAAAVGMFFGLVWYLIDQRALGDAGKDPAPVSGPEEERAIRTKLWRAVGILGGVGALIFLLQSMSVITITAAGVSNAFGVILLLVVVAFFGWLFYMNEWTPDERRRLVVIMVLFLGASVFWSVFEQSGSTLSLFADRSTRNVAFGTEFPSSWWQSVNALMIVVMAGFFAWLWVRMGSRNPSHPAKFAIGLVCVALSFALMVPAASMASNGNQVGWWWLFGCFFLQTVGELCLSPVGLSAMTKLAPTRVVSLMMGVWFMATSVGSYIGGKVSSVYESFSLPTLFGAVAVYAFVFAIILALLVNPIKRMLARSV